MMIDIDISTLVFVYIAATTLSVLMLWAFFDFGTKLRTYSSEEGYLRNCKICANNYIDSRGEDLSKCPRCGSYNKRSEEIRNEKRV